MRRIGKARCGLLPFALVCALPLAFPLQGEQPPIPAGKWLLVPEESDDIEQSIEEFVSEMSFLVRRFARSRLRAANRTIHRVIIKYPGSDVHISLRADEPPVITPRDGEVVPYAWRNGEVVRANTKLRPGLIRQLFDSDEGRKEMIYRLLPGGKMALETTISSERLKEPLRYTWVYRREG